jgi:hypothetical protein
MEERVAIMPIFLHFSSHIFSQTVQKVSVKVNVDRTVKRNKFAMNIQHLLSFFWCLIVMTVCHLQPTLHRPGNINAIQKPLFE